jgi:hypothetical protein
MIKWIVAALCLAVGLPGSAMAQEEWRSPVVAAQMVAANKSFGGQGYTPTAWAKQDDLKAGGASVFEINIVPGDAIMMLAVCDKACTDLDIQVFDPSGNQIGADEESDATPIVKFTGASEGLFKVRVTMVNCSAPTCAIGVKGFWKRPGQAAQPAPTKQPQPQRQPQAAKSIPEIMVAGPDGAPKMLVGINGFGPASSLTKMEQAATAAGLNVTDRVVGGEQIDHTMIVFGPGTDAARAREFYRKAVDGSFGFLMVEALLVSPEDAKDGITSSEVRKMGSDKVKEISQTGGERFDLSCAGQRSGTAGAGTFAIELRIDLGANTWCIDECKKVYPIVNVTSDRITLYALENASMTLMRWVDRATNEYHDTTKSALLVSANVGQCKKAPFKPIPSQS